MRWCTICVLWKELDWEQLRLVCLIALITSSVHQGTHSACIRIAGERVPILPLCPAHVVPAQKVDMRNRPSLFSPSPIFLAAIQASDSQSRSCPPPLPPFLVSRSSSFRS